LSTVVDEEALDADEAAWLDFLQERRALTAAAWDETAHPRQPAGSARGGEFRGVGLLREIDRQRAERAKQYGNGRMPDHFPMGVFEPGERVKFWPNKIGTLRGEPIWKAITNYDGEELAFWFADRYGKPHHSHMAAALGLPAVADPHRYNRLSAGHGMTPNDYDDLDLAKAVVARHGKDIRDAQEMREALVAAVWDETKHRRHPAGSPHGGEFAPKGIGSVTPDEIENAAQEQSVLASMMDDGVDRGGTKNKVMRDLAKRLEGDPEWDPEAVARAPLWMGYAKHDPANLSEESVDMLVQAWAHSSSDSHLPSLLLQQAVADEFGLDFEADDLVHGSMMQGGSDVLPQFRQLRADPKVYGSVRAFVRAQYQATQELLRNTAPAELAYRGMRFDGGSSPFPHGVSKTGFDMNPASSWSLDYTTARTFASGRPGADAIAVLAARIPRERILATPLTGQGAKMEYELIVIGSGHSERDQAVVLASGANSVEGIPHEPEGYAEKLRGGEPREP
jgi:hypothetical protein